MKVKVTNAMAKEIKKALSGIAENVTFGKMNMDLYKWNVDTDLFSHEDDFDMNTNKFKVIRIDYPGDCYAIPAYVTTQDLVMIFRNSDRTYDGFFKEIRNAYAI
jgi:hypothetical protein